MMSHVPVLTKPFQLFYPVHLEKKIFKIGINLPMAFYNKCVDIALCFKIAETL